MAKLGWLNKGSNNENNEPKRSCSVGCEDKSLLEQGKESTLKLNPVGHDWKREGSRIEYHSKDAPKCSPLHQPIYRRREPDVQKPLKELKGTSKNWSYIEFRQKQLENHQGDKISDHVARETMSQKCSVSNHALFETSRKTCKDSILERELVQDPYSKPNGPEPTWSKNARNYHQTQASAQNLSSYSGSSSSLFSQQGSDSKSNHALYPGAYTKGSNTSDAGVLQPNQQIPTSQIVPPPNNGNSIANIDQRQTPNYDFYECMRNERERLSTFFDFPRENRPRCETLAAAGFFYLGTLDRTQCAFCRIILSSWQPYDIPMAEHRTHAPDCPFVCNRTVGNIPLTSSLFQSTSSLTNTLSPATMKEQRGHPNETFLAFMRSEHERRATFFDFPDVNPQRREALAAAGFFFIGREDYTQCAFCHGVLCKWEPGDIPLEDHRRSYPECQFVNGSDVGNIPFNEVANLPSDLPRYIQPSSLGITTASNLSSQHPTPILDEVARRIASFDNANWNFDGIQSKRQLAEAGFTYAGTGDCVQCYSCGRGLRGWKPHDDPWAEHALLSPDCAHVCRIKGVTYIAEVQHSHLRNQMSSLSLTHGPSPSYAAPKNTGSSGSLSPPRSVPHQFEDREVKARMDLPHVRMIIDQGYPIDLVKKVIEERLRTTGDDFPDVRSLHMAVVTQGAQHTPQQSGPQASASPRHRRTGTGEVPVEQASVDVVTRVIEMGYSPPLVRHVFEEERRLTGDAFPTVESLVDALMAREESQLGHISGPHRPAPASPVHGQQYSRSISDPTEQAHLKAPMVRMATDMGYSPSLVREVIEERLMLTGEGFPTIAELLDALLSREEAQFGNHGSLSNLTHSASIFPGVRQMMSNSPLSLPCELTPYPQSSNQGLPQEDLRNKLQAQSLQYHHLAQQHEKVKEEKRCKVCLDSKAEMVFMPCGHMVCCPDCATRLSKCPMCRQSIERTVKVYQ